MNAPKVAVFGSGQACDGRGENKRAAGRRFPAGTKAQPFVKAPEALALHATKVTLAGGARPTDVAFWAIGRRHPNY
jgi:hypothetical protein